MGRHDGAVRVALASYDCLQRVSPPPTARSLVFRRHPCESQAASATTSPHAAPRPQAATGSHRQPRALTAQRRSLAPPEGRSGRAGAAADKHQYSAAAKGGEARLWARLGSSPQDTRQIVYAAIRWWKNWRAYRPTSTPSAKTLARLAVVGRAWRGAGDGPVSRGHAVDRRPRPAVCTARSASAVRRAESHPVSHRPSGTARRGLLPWPRHNTRGEDW